MRENLAAEPWIKGLSNHGSKKKKKKTTTTTTSSSSSKDHVISVRGGDLDIEEHRRSIERVVNAESGDLDSIHQGGRDLASPLRNDLNTRRIRSSSQNLHKRWCRQVKIVLAIDGAICVVLFLIWLVICRGTRCIS